MTKLCRGRITLVLPFCWLAIVLLLLSSCSSMGPIERSDGAHILENFDKPVRRVSVAVLAPDPRHFHELAELVSETSQQLFQQTGIALYVKSFAHISWQSSDRVDMLQQVADQMRNVAEPCDMTLAYAPMSIGQLLFFYTFGGWEGVIDDVYRRHIVLRTKDRRVLLHELVHAFLLSETHTEGLMSAVRVCLVPGAACLTGSSQLSAKDRNEVLRNKWRNFSSKVHVPFVEDRIN